MSTEHGFKVIDANESVEPQQDRVRKLVANAVKLKQFKA